MRSFSTEDRSLLRTLPRQLAAGVVVGVMSVAFALSLAALIFKGDLAPNLGRGAGWALTGVVVIGVVAAVTSSFRGMVAGPQGAPAVVLAAAAAGLVAGAEDPLASLAAFIILTSAFTGAVLLLMGRFRLGRLVRYMPFPVIAGFLGGTGLVLVVTGIGILFPSGGDNELGFRVIPGLAVGLLIVGLDRRGASSVVRAAVIGLAFVGYHVSAAVAGVDKAEGIARGLLLGPFPEGSLADPGVIAELGSADWGAVAGQVPALMVMALLVPLGLLLNTGGLEHAFKRDIDVDRELMASGAGLMAAAPFAGLPGYVKLGSTMIGQEIGGSSRLPPLVAAVIGAVVLAVGADAVSLVPVIIPGGLLLAIGVDFMLTWVWDIRRRIGWHEHGVIIAIVGTVAVFGFLQGVGLGILAATILFVLRYSRIPAVRSLATARERRSNVQRSAAEEATLTEVGDRVSLAELQGYLFFGTAEQIVGSVRDTVRARPHVSVIILDFRRVTGMDSSAGASFERLARFADEQRLEVVLSGANPEVTAALQPTLDPGTMRHEVDLDHALETCEEHLLGAPSRAHGGERRVPYAAGWEAVPATELAAGSVIVTEGQRDAGVFYLESGRAVVTATVDDDREYRRAVLLPGSVVGELSHLTGGPATATVICDTNCVVRHMSDQWIADLAATDPAQAFALQRLIAARLADKLTAANRTIRSLL